MTTTRADELFSLYPQLALRVTHLRSILNNIVARSGPPPLLAERKAWLADVQSVSDDFLNLIQQTAELLGELPPPSTPEE